MAMFEKAVLTVLKHEGYKSDHADDPGGNTAYGISLRFLHETDDLDDDGWQDGDIDRDGVITGNDVDALSIEDATRLYRLYFWEPNHYHRINEQDIATKCLDYAVNMGRKRANRIVQRAVRAAIGLRLAEDGILGSKSLHGINMCKPEKLMTALKSEGAGYYRLLADKYPKLQVFLTGWLNRAYSDPIRDS